MRSAKSWSSTGSCLRGSSDSSAGWTRWPPSLLSAWSADSKNGSLSSAPKDGIRDRVKALGARLVIDKKRTSTSGYLIERPANADRLTVRIAERLARPYAEVRGKRYQLSFRRGRPSGPAVIVKNRPREIVFNTGHPAVGEECTDRQASQVLALELAFLLSNEGTLPGCTS